MTIQDETVMNNEERRGRIAALDAVVRQLNTQLCGLRGECPHEWMKVGASVQCRICGEDGGWWCPDSPDHLCLYTDDFDQCDFCGQPEERK